MKERPILFKGEMVRAILAGRKTQTRRMVKPQPSDSFLPGDVGMYYPTLEDKEDGEQYPGPVRFGVSDENEDYPFQYGIIGSHLWVKETFNTCGGKPFYRASGEMHKDWKWKPSIFMPRWASRITLEIVNVRVERLQAINDFDAFQEGAKSECGTVTGPACMSFIQGYKTLWESINGAGSWAKNPWVWVIEFKKL